MRSKKPSVLASARAAGINGYCPKGIAISELVTVIRQIVAGEYCWDLVTPIANPQVSTRRGWLTHLLNGWRLSGLQQIEVARSQSIAQLQNPALSPLNRALTAGQLRELKAARWFIERLLTPISDVQPRTQASPTSLMRMPSSIPSLAPREPHGVGILSGIEDSEVSDVRDTSPSQLLAVQTQFKTVQSLQAALFLSTHDRLPRQLKESDRRSSRNRLFSRKKKNENCSRLFYAGWRMLSMNCAFANWKPIN